MPIYLDFENEFMIIQHLCLQDTKNYKCQRQLDIKANYNTINLKIYMSKM